MRRLFTFLMISLVCGAFAGTINVTSPGEGDFLGRNNTVRFNATGVLFELRVVVTATRVADPNDVIRIEQRFDPDSDNEVSGSMTLNFSESTPEGDYTIKVTADEPTNPGNNYNMVQFGVIVDVNEPEFLNFNPISGAFVKGIVPITVEIDEPNLREWRVQIDNSDIPNNSGTSATFTVNWDTDTVIQDGQKTINLRAEDEADNNSTKNISVTIDRIRPTITILAPDPDGNIRPNSTIPVVVEVVDQFNNSVDVTGIDVVLRRLDDSYLGRVARTSTNNSGGTITWNGRIRYSRRLPSEFKIVVNAIDRAGNVAIEQEIIISTNRTRRGRGIRP